MLNRAQLAQHKVQLALYACGFLFIFTETLLSPFYPQFFAKVFGLDDAYITGEFMAMCRLVVIFSAPVWGILAKHVDPIKLLISGQAAAAVFTGAIAWVENIQQFYVLTILLLMFKSSYLLFYTLLIDLNQNTDQDPLAKTVGWVQVIMHLAIISSTLVSAWVIQVDNPLDLFIYAALIDVLQVLACIYVLRNRAKPAINQKKSEPEKRKLNWSFIALLALIIFSFHWAVNIIRPFFTQFSQQHLALTEFQSAVAFLLPSLMVLLVIPFIRRICTHRHIKQVLFFGLSILLISAVLQFYAQDFVQLIVVRCLLGLSLILVTAALDIFIFTSSEKENVHFNYSLSIAVQNIALFLSPLSAAGVVAHYSIEAPFMASSMIYGLCLVFTLAAFAQLKRSNIYSKEAIA